MVLTAADTARLHRWIARAGFPEERLRCPAFACAEEQNEVVVKDRRDAWNALFDSADAELAALKQDLLRARGLTEEEWLQGLRDYVVAAPQHLPEWATTFINLYQSWPRHEDAEAKHPPDKPYLRLTSVWAGQCRAWVEKQRAQLQSAGVHLSDAAVDDLLEHLAYRLATPVFAVLNAWPGGLPAPDAKDGGGDSWRFLQTIAFWQRAFDRQPILAKVIGNLTRLWQVATAEMLTRFAADAPRLVAQGFLRAPDNKTAGEITVLRLPCGLGDPHRGGRSVAIFETDRGDAVYKPKDLAGTRATGRLLRDLHQAQPKFAPLFVPLAPEFLYRRGYGWERKVAARECESPAQVETFYRRLGGWLFLLQLLNGNDFWYDNLIACADMPYFIDFETVVGNDFGEHFLSDAGARNEHVQQFYAMRMIGILPLLMPGSVDGALADGIDISVATPPGKQPIPFAKPNFASPQPHNGAADAGGFYGDFEASDYAPFYRGEFQDMNFFLNEFIDGYQRMGALLNAKAGRAALNKFIRRIARARFRHIVIDTWSCYALLGKVFGNCRTDGARAAIMLDGLSARFRRYPRRIADGIREDLWRNDVPLFELQTDSLQLFNTAGEATEEDFFRATALDKIARNRDYLAAEMERQIGHIKVLFATRPDNPRRVWRADGADGETRPVSRDEQLMLAQQIGARLAGDLSAGELQHYLAIGRLQLNNITVAQPLPLDYNGCSGIMVFLALLRRHCAQHSARDEMDAALNHCCNYLLNENIAGHVFAGEKNLAPLCGMVSLFGCKLIALSHLAQAQNQFGLALERDPAAGVEKLMNEFLDDLSAAEGLCADYRHGVSGLLTRLHELQTVLAADLVENWMRQILTAVENKQLRLSPPQTDSYRAYIDALLPNAAVGMRLLDTCLQAKWPALVKHAGYRELQRFIAEQNQQNSASPESPSPKPLRDLPGEALINRAYQPLAGGGGDGSAAPAQTENSIAELVARRRSSGRWFPDRWADDRFAPGAIYGQADIGLLLLSACEGANLNPFRRPGMP